MVVLGSVNVDLVVRVDELPAPGQTVTGGVFEQHHGGKGANQAVAAARLGASVTLIGAVGDDDFGRAARDALGREGISVEGLATLRGSSTGVALIVVDWRGENQVAVASGANRLLDAAIWRGVGEPHAGSVFVSNFEVSDEAVIAGAVRASRSGGLVLINVAPARDLSRELLSTKPILVANESEAQEITGERDAAAAVRELTELTGAPAIVTLGPGGALAVDGGEATHVPAPPVDAVDTTGAGDTFVGALAAELSNGRPLTDAVRFAVQAASLSVRVPGARAGMPTRADVETSLKPGSA